MSSIEHITQRMNALDERPRAHRLPDPGEHEYQTLKASILANGVQIPVEVTEDGTLLDGYQRWKVCVEEGLPDPPQTIRKIEDEDKRTEHAITLNLARRQMDPVTRAECVKALAKAKGIKFGRPGGRPEAKKNPATVSGLSLEVGISERQIRRDQQLLALPKDLREQVRSGDVAAKVAIARAAKPKSKDRPDLDPHGEYHTLLIEPDWGGETFHRIANLKLADDRKVLDLIHPEGCHVYLRCPSQHLAKGPALLAEWGLEYATCLTLETSPRPGTYFDSTTTHLMFGVLGRQPTSRRHGASLLTGSDTHNMIRKLISTASPGPYLGLHARGDGWRAYDPVTGDVLEPAT